MKYGEKIVFNTVKSSKPPHYLHQFESVSRAKVCAFFFFPGVDVLFSFADAAAVVAAAALCRSSGVRHPEWNDGYVTVTGCGLHPCREDCFTHLSVAIFYSEFISERTLFSLPKVITKSEVKCASTILHRRILQYLILKKGMLKT